MIRSAKHLLGFWVDAQDGSIGKVARVFFDDEKWAVRYLVVHTDGWLHGRNVLISPISIKAIDWKSKSIVLTLSREEIERSPDIDTDKPIYREAEIRYFNYYRWPYYWAGSGLWGVAAYPGMPSQSRLIGVTGGIRTGQYELHLRSVGAIMGNRIVATDGPFGNVQDFLFDDITWSIPYLAVDTKSWWPSKWVLIPSASVARVSWTQGYVNVRLNKGFIKGSPRYRDTAEVRQELLNRVDAYYGSELELAA